MNVMLEGHLDKDCSMNREERDNSGLLYALVVAVLVALLLGLTGCDPCARLSRRCPPTATVRDSVWVHDSVWVERWRTDTVVRVRLERETVREAVPFADTAFAETAYAQALSCLHDGNLVLRLENKDSAEMLLSAYHELRNAYREAVASRHEVQVRTVYKCRPIVKAGAWFGLASLLYLIVSCVLFVRRQLHR